LGSVGDSKPSEASQEKEESKLPHEFQMTFLPAQAMYPGNVPK
jgi:hypothetical protein